MRILRITGVLVGVVVALLVVGVIALLLFVDPNRYRGEIERVASEHTGRALAIQGKLELKIFPWLALAVHDVQLSNRPGFGSEPFLTVRSASIGVRLLPLLAKRLEVSRIGLDGASVNLVARGAENNWSDLGASKGPSQSAPAGSPLLGSVSIERVDLSKSALVYREETRNSTTELANLELHSGRFETGGARTALANLNLQGTWLARTGDRKSSEAPKPLAFSVGTPGLTLDTGAQTLAPAKITVKVGDSALLVAVSGEKMSTERLLTGSVTVPSTSPRKLLQSLGIAPPITRDSRALSAFGLQTNFRLTRKQLQLTALQVILDDTRMQGTAAVEDFDRSALAFDLNMNEINVDRYRAPVPQSPVRPSASPAPAKPPTPLPLETLRKLDAHGTLRVASATFGGLAFTGVLMPLVAKDGHIRLGPTKAGLYGGSYNGDIVLDARPAEAQLSLDQHVQGTDIGAIVKAALDSARLTGRADANVAVTGVGSTDQALIRSLNGKIDANVKQGALIGIDLVYELQRANALLKRELPPQRSGPARTVFNTLQANGTLDKGVLRIEALRLETDFLKVHGRGTLDTATEAINYQLVASLNKLPAGGSATGGNAGSGALTVEVPLIITGTVSSPTVRPDIEALARGKLGQEVQQKAGELVKKKVGDKLKDLLGH